MESKKYNKLVNITKTKQTHRYKEQTSGYQQGEGRREGGREEGEEGRGVKERIKGDYFSQNAKKNLNNSNKNKNNFPLEIQDRC